MGGKLMSDYLYKDMPKLGFGLMRLPTIPGGTQKDIDFDQRVPLF